MNFSEIAETPYRVMMDEFELSFMFDEANYETDFSGDLYDFEIMWKEIGDEVHEKEENEQFQKMFQQQLYITQEFDKCHNERYI